MRMLCLPRVTHLLKAVKTKCLPIKIGMLKSVLAGVNGKSLCYSKDDIQISSLWLSSCADRKQHCRKTTAALFISVGISTQGHMPNKWNYYLWQKVISGSLYTHVCLNVHFLMNWLMIGIEALPVTECTVSENENMTFIIECLVNCTGSPCVPCKACLTGLSTGGRPHTVVISLVLLWVRE